jgi:hypothetical protein
MKPITQVRLAQIRAMKERDRAALLLCEDVHVDILKQLGPGWLAKYLAEKK